MSGTVSTNLLCIAVRCGEVESEEDGIDVLTFNRIILFCTLHKNQKVCSIFLVIISLSSHLTSQRTITSQLSHHMIFEDFSLLSYKEGLVGPVSFTFCLRFCYSLIPVTRKWFRHRSHLEEFFMASVALRRIFCNVLLT